MSGDRVRVLYIAGWGRSGSTVLTNVLGQVPGLFPGGELRYVWERNLAGDHDCGCGEAFLDCPVWREVVERSGAAASREALPRLLADVASDRAIPSLLTRRGSRRLLATLGPEAERIVALYRAIRDVTGARVVVDSSKVPSYAALLSQLDGLDLRVLHLVRDPRAVAWSWLRRKMQRDVGREMLRRSAFESAWRWSVRNAEVRLFWKSGQARFLRMRYEELIRRPEASIRRILELCGEPSAPLPFVGPSVVEMRRAHSSSGNPDRFKTGPVTLRLDEEWRQRMRRRDRFVVGALTWPLLLGYGFVPRGAADR